MHQSIKGNWCRGRSACFGMRPASEEGPRKQLRTRGFPFGSWGQGRAAAALRRRRKNGALTPAQHAVIEPDWPRGAGAWSSHGRAADGTAPGGTVGAEPKSRIDTDRRTRDMLKETLAAIGMTAI